MINIKIELETKRRVSMLWINGERVTDYDFDVAEAIHVMKQLKKHYGIDVRKQLLEE